MKAETEKSWEEMKKWEEWGGGGLEKGCGFDFVLGCAIVWVEIWILTSVKKMGGVNPGMGKILIFMISCFVWVLGRRKKWCSF